MIQYPRMEKGAVVGVTAPSSGIEPGLHDMFRTAVSRMEERGYHIRVGETVWTQHKAKSAPARVRAEELNEMLRDPRIGAIIPPWGGELLIEMLDRVDFDHMPRKWILGYSDLSVLLLAITLKTGVATAHGLNFVDLRGTYSDPTSAMWEAVLTAKPGDRIAQQASAKYQKEWRHDDPSPCVFHLTEPTVWKTVSGGPESLQGRLLGGMRRRYPPFDRHALRGCGSIPGAPYSGRTSPLVFGELRAEHGRSAQVPCSDEVCRLVRRLRRADVRPERGQPSNGRILGGGCIPGAVGRTGRTGHLRYRLRSRSAANDAGERRLCRSEGGWRQRNAGPAF